jgi:curli biogenesis system outer membrane secretion channel CsgG
MLAHLILVGLLWQVASVPQATPAPAAASVATPVKQASPDVDDPMALLKVKRIYVDSFGDDIISKELQSMILSSLVATKRFKVTENRDKADAVLKGVALEKTSQEVHAYGEATSVGGAAGGAHSSISGSGGTFSGSSGGGFVARHMGTSDSSLSTETIDDARVAIRLVNPDGDVIWTTTQESKGAKYKGASADVADQCIKQLIRDVTKLETASGSSSGSATTASDSSTRH